MITNKQLGDLGFTSVPTLVNFRRRAWRGKRGDEVPTQRPRCDGRPEIEEEARPAGGSPSTRCTESARTVVIWRRC